MSSYEKYIYITGESMQTLEIYFPHNLCKNGSHTCLSSGRVCILLCILASLKPLLHENGRTCNFKFLPPLYLMEITRRQKMKKHPKDAQRTLSEYSILYSTVVNTDAITMAKAYHCIPL